MKATSHRIAISSAALLLLSTLNSQLSTCFAQGLLTPPGPPAPTMKRLDAIDPGRPLNPASFGTTGIIIDQPGNYYLTGNVTTVPGTETAIIVLASQVTIDLRGFALIAGGGTGAGTGDVAISIGLGQRNVIVRNGTIRGTWWAGVYTSTRECAVENVRVFGTVAYGIRLDDHAQVSRCRVDGLSGTGFITSAGIFVGDQSTVRECIVTSCDGNGIQAATGASVLDCVVNANTIDGITVGNGSVVSRCAASLNGDEGIAMASNCTVVDCAAYSNGGSGVGAISANITGTSAFSSDNRGFDLITAVITGSVAVRSTNAGFHVNEASSISACVAGANNADGFVSFSGASNAGSTIFDACTAYNSGQTTADANADGFEITGAKVTHCVAVNSRGWGLRVAGTFGGTGTVDGNLFISNDAGGMVFSSSYSPPLTIRNGVDSISPPPSTTFYDLLAPFGTAQSDQPFVNF